jgi:uncharacterized protein YukE
MAQQPLTETEFKVDLRQLSDAIGSVRRERDNIEHSMTYIGTEFRAAKEAWQFPSAYAYDDMQNWFMRVSGELKDLLDEIIRRMQDAYQTYHAAEVANTGNVTPKGGGHDA